MMICGMLILMLTNQTRADTPSCKDVINACNDALEDKKTEVIKANVVIQQQDSYNKALTEDLKTTKDSLNAWYHDPKWMTTIGIVLGLGVGALYFKH